MFKYWHCKVYFRINFWRIESTNLKIFICGKDFTSNGSWKRLIKKMWMAKMNETILSNISLYKITNFKLAIISLGNETSSVCADVATSIARYRTLNPIRVL